MNNDESITYHLTNKHFQINHLSATKTGQASSTQGRRAMAFYCIRRKKENLEAGRGFRVLWACGGARSGTSERHAFSCRLSRFSGADPVQLLHRPERQPASHERWAGQITGIAGEIEGQAWTQPKLAPVPANRYPGAFSPRPDPGFYNSRKIPDIQGRLY
jgi:hypothetical protein